MREVVEVDGRKRTFTVVGERASTHRRDLLLVFHGSKQDGEAHRTFTGESFDAMARGGAAVVVYLDGHKGNWNDARKESYFPARTEDVDDMGYVRAVISELEASHRIDPHRVFGVGYSNGGQMVFRLVHEDPELLAGAVVISATMPAPQSFQLPAAAPEALPLPVLLIHGTEDRIVPYHGGTMSWWARRIFKVGGTTLSMPATADYFARRNRISTAPSTHAAPRGEGASSAKTWIEQTDYVETDRPSVRLITIHGGGHTVPGPRKAPIILGRTHRDISAAAAAAGFFGITAPTAPRR